MRVALRAQGGAGQSRARNGAEAGGLRTTLGNGRAMVGCGHRGRRLRARRSSRSSRSSRDTGCKGRLRYTALSLQILAESLPWEAPSSPNPDRGDLAPFRQPRHHAARYAEDRGNLGGLEEVAITLKRVCVHCFSDLGYERCKTNLHLGVAQCARFAYSTSSQADMAQLVEHNLAKVGVAGSSPVVRSIVCARADESRPFAYTAKWPSGKAEACKAFTPGSNPGAASITLRKGRPAGCPFCYSSAFTAPASFAISTPLQPTMPIPMERSEAHCDPS